MFRPPVNRAMRVLDRSFFQRDVQLSAARVHDNKNLSQIRHELSMSKDLLALRMVSPIRPDPTDSANVKKCILLRPEVNNHDRSTWSESVTRLHNQEQISLFPYNLTLDYSHWTAADILSAILPDDFHNDLPTGFSPVGHVAHFNLRERYLPYKHLIGQVTMDKNPTIKTVINKTDTLGSENEYRVLDHEVIAGEPNLNVEVREAGSAFRFDYSKVFWNTRLGTEHHRLIDKFKAGDAICDVMAGVGPFAIPAGRKGVFVWANDLNPDCYKGLLDATPLNKVDQFVHAFNENGHSFIKAATKDLLSHDYRARIPIKMSRTEVIKRNISPSKRYREIEAPKTFSHFIMNLPATAIDFLPNFIGLYTNHEDLFQPRGPAELPLIHCYCFGPKSDDDEKDYAAAENLIWSQISAKLGVPLHRDTSDVELFDVRDVAPNKRQYCATFRLPAACAFHDQPPSVKQNESV